MKIEVLELLSVVCMYSDEGHELVIEALAHYKVSLASLLQCMIICACRKILLLTYFMIIICVFKL